MNFAYVFEIGEDGRTAIVGRGEQYHVLVACDSCMSLQEAVRRRGRLTRIEMRMSMIDELNSWTSTVYHVCVTCGASYTDHSRTSQRCDPCKAVWKKQQSRERYLKQKQERKHKRIA